VAGDLAIPREHLWELPGSDFGKLRRAVERLANPNRSEWRGIWQSPASIFGSRPDWRICQLAPSASDMNRTENFSNWATGL